MFFRFSLDWDVYLKSAFNVDLGVSLTIATLLAFAELFLQTALHFAICLGVHLVTLHLAGLQQMVVLLIPVLAVLL